MRDAALLAGLAISVPAGAQPGVIKRWSSIPTDITMEKLGDLPQQVIYLKTNCGPATDDASAPAVGTAIIRQLELNGKTVQMQSAVTAADRRGGRRDIPVDSTVRRRLRGTLFIDKKAPSRLRVNPYLQTRPPAWLDCPATATPGDTTTTAATRLREAEFFYDLSNRQTVGFRTITLGFSGVTVPLRYRPGYTAGNGQEIAGTVADPLSLGVQFGASLSRLRYQYVRNADNPLQESSRLTLGAVALLGKATVGAKTSRSATTPVTDDASFLTLSFGPALTMNVRGVDVGVYGAPEFPLQGGSARQWDFDRKWWWGVGLAFVPGK